MLLDIIYIHQIKFVIDLNILILKNIPYLFFFRKANISFTYNEGVKYYEKYKIKLNNIILHDSPYFTLDNDFYEIKDGLNIYKYLDNNKIGKENAKIYLILQLKFIIF